LEEEGDKEVTTAPKESEGLERVGQVTWSQMSCIIFQLLKSHVLNHLHNLCNFLNNFRYFPLKKRLSFPQW